MLTFILHASNHVIPHIINKFTERQNHKNESEALAQDD